MASVSDIRSGFLEFFRRNGHEIRPSSSLVPHNDPTLMFTAAGMVPFKNVFTGIEKVPFSRAASSQKCVRAGGKHNDLDNVGYTARHHTFFEMLGNFSFGDYFKEEAINFAWELLTKDYGLPPERLCVTVYHDDDFAWDHWKKITGFADHKIIRINSSDNFWSAGDTGPCGPCSEIFYDHGAHIAGGPPGSPDADGDRFVEIWNLVFMQYDQLEGGRRIDLPKPSIDTGMGLERISAVLQGVHDNYDIDLFRHLIASIKEEAAKIGGQPAKESAPYKVIADHLRSSCFLIADGVLPSNEGRGYVLRRIMRRGMRYAHQLGCQDPLMYRLVPSLITEMGAQYPELKRAEATITDNLRQEEERFKQTLERGLKLLEEETEKLGKGQKLPGDAAFKLYDTYGFPLDLTQDILKGRGMAVDTEGFERAMEGQRDMARAAHKGSGDTATGRIWFELKEKLGATEFLGYDADVADSKVLAIIKQNESVSHAQAEEEVFIILDQTPFYGESGGQVGDTGQFVSGKAPAAVILDTLKPLEDFIVHKAKLSVALKVGDTVHAAIDTATRNATRANHSATHLLHKALRDALGTHVTQKGSLVAPDRLRFDFSHAKAVTREEINAIEAKVNQVIQRNTPVACTVMSPDEAIKAGAMALFGEKYGDKVRVLAMGEDSGATYSTELCGGTHVRNTGDIGMFRITSEGSVSSGVRRIEAVTGENVRASYEEDLQKLYGQFNKLREDHTRLMEELAEARQKLSPDAPPPVVPLAVTGSYSTKDLFKDAKPAELRGIFEKESARLQESSQKLQDDNKKLSKELAEAKKQLVLGSGNMNVTPERLGDIHFIGKSFEGLDPKELRPLAENFLKQAEPGVVAVGTAVDGKASVVVGVSKSLSNKFSAVTLVQTAVAELGGKGGGGKPDMAQGGGPDADKLDAALTKIRSALS